jgi:hypothetical protein
VGGISISDGLARAFASRAAISSSVSSGTGTAGAPNFRPHFPQNLSDLSPICPHSHFCGTTSFSPSDRQKESPLLGFVGHIGQISSFDEPFRTGWVARISCWTSFLHKQRHCGSRHSACWPLTQDSQNPGRFVLLPAPAFHGSVSSFEPIRSRLCRTRYPAPFSTPARKAWKGPIMQFANSVTSCTPHAQARYTKHLTESMPKRMVLSMATLPTCGNFLAGTCERSDVYVSKETDTAFVIACRTCASVNVWPKDKNESAGKYEAYLRHQAAREAQYQYDSSRPAYSFLTSGDKT